MNQVRKQGGDMQIQRPNGRVYNLVPAGLIRGRIHTYQCVDAKTKTIVGFCAVYKDSDVYGPICSDERMAARRAFNVAMAHHYKEKQR